MASKYLAASILDSLLLRLRVCMGWSSVLLKAVLSTQVAPTPEGRWKVFTSCWGLASGDSLRLQGEEQVRCSKEPESTTLAICRVPPEALALITAEWAHTACACRSRAADRSQRHGWHPSETPWGGWGLLSVRGRGPSQTLLQSPTSLGASPPSCPPSRSQGWEWGQGQGQVAGRGEWQLSPVLTPLLVGVRNEVALGLGVVVVL